MLKQQAFTASPGTPGGLWTTPKHAHKKELWKLKSVNVPGVFTSRKPVFSLEHPKVSANQRKWKNVLEGHDKMLV